MACIMSPLDSNDLHRIFELLDRNGDGLVSLEELNWLLKRIGVHVHTSLDELQALVGKTSLDITDFKFFYGAIIKENINGKSKLEKEDDSLEGDLAKAFGVFDLNGNGFISSDELQNVLSRLGLWDERNGHDCRTMINVYDANSDGLLDFEEFKDMMLITNS